MSERYELSHDQPPVHPTEPSTVDPRPRCIIENWGRLPEDSPWKRAADPPTPDAREDES